eukprot:1160218-Pelagomonas_calceolata.AAC.21
MASINIWGNADCRIVKGSMVAFNPCKGPDSIGQQDGGQSLQGTGDFGTSGAEEEEEDGADFQSHVMSGGLASGKAAQTVAALTESRGLQRSQNRRVPCSVRRRSSFMQ